MAKIIAHRGANKLAPQNTKAAFKKALEIGVDGFENDVHLTKDGHIVICHNYTVDETSNGSGLISEMTFKELRNLDFGSYFSEEFKGEKIMTLAEFLEISRDLELINIEIKEPKEKNNLVSETIKMVQDFSMEDQVILSSFGHDLLKESKEIEPKIRTGGLYALNTPGITEIANDYVGFAKKYNLDALHPFVMFVDEEFIETAHKNNLTVNAWTVNDRDDMHTLSEMGVDGIITDVPELW